MPLTEKQKERLRLRATLIVKGDKQGLAHLDMLDALENAMTGVVGPMGPQGITGIQGRPGLPGKDAPVIDEEKLFKRLQQGMRMPKDGKDGNDGRDGYTPQKNVDYFDGQNGIGLPGKDGSPDTAEEILAKLLTLGSGFLPASAVKDLPTVTRELPQIALFGGGTRGSTSLTVMGNGVSYGQDIRKINFIGATLSRVADGVVSVAVSASAITGLIQAGTNVTITGSGTSEDPYIINATGGGGGLPFTVSTYASIIQDSGPSTLIGTGGDNDPFMVSTQGPDGNGFYTQAVTAGGSWATWFDANQPLMTESNFLGGFGFVSGFPSLTVGGNTITYGPLGGLPALHATNTGQFSLYMTNGAGSFAIGHDLLNTNANNLFVYNANSGIAVLTISTNDEVSLGTPGIPSSTGKSILSLGTASGTPSFLKMIMSGAQLDNPLEIFNSAGVLIMNIDSSGNIITSAEISTSLLVGVGAGDLTLGGNGNVILADGSHTLNINAGIVNIQGNTTFTGTLNFDAITPGNCTSQTFINGSLISATTL